MYKGNASRIVPIILVLIVIAIAIAALVSVGRTLFGGGDQSAQTPIDVGRDSLLSLNVDRSVRMTVRGPIVADENFRSYRITAAPNSRSLNTYTGYLKQTLSTTPLPNNSKAYEEFVYALDRANLMKGEVPTDEVKNDTRGICATGRVYEFEVLQNDNSLKRLWASTCKGSPGTFRGSVNQVERLFHDQIPDSKKLLSTIDL
jgi:hypothetical protein